MEQNQNDTIQLNEEEVRLEKLSILKKNNESPFKYTFDKTHSTSWVLKNFNDLESGQSNEENLYNCAGRIISKRNHGKAFFGNIQDESGILQFYTNLTIIGE